MTLQTLLAPNILGTIGTVCGCVNLLPQILSNYRKKNTDGLPTSMLLLWVASGIPSGAYAIAQDFSVSLIAQPQCFSFLCSVTWAQCLVYGRQWRPATAIALVAVAAAGSAAAQVGLVFAIRLGHTNGVYWPVVAIGCIACILDLVGFFPIPFELLKRRGRNVGLDFLFLALDWCGAFFSLMALVAQCEFDVLFGVTYALCCIVEMGVVASHLVWMLRTRGIRKRAREARKSYDEFDEGVRWQAEGVDVEKALRGLFAKASPPREAVNET